MCRGTFARAGGYAHHALPSDGIGQVSPGDELTVLADRLRWDRRRNPTAGRRQYHRDAADLTDRCTRLLADGQAPVVVPVLRKAVDRVTTALMYLHDSGAIGNQLHQLMTMYARACAAAPPNPKTLAGWLVKLQCDGPGWPDIRLRDFATALGTTGLDHLATLVEQRRTSAEADSWSAAFAVRNLREQLAEVSGDLDRYVAVLAEHLAGPHQYRRIAQALHDAGRNPEAIDWARRGLADGTGGLYADQLRDLLVAILVDTGDRAGAVQERRTEYARRPTANNWRALHRTAAAAGSDDPQLATWAVELATQRTTENPGLAGELIDVLLDQGDEDQAWQVALTHTDQLLPARWAELLELRQATHPGEVIALYRQLIEDQILDSYDKRRYQKAIKLLHQLANAHRATATTTEFTHYLADLRIRHKRRPTFLTKLDSARL